MRHPLVSLGPAPRRWSVVRNHVLFEGVDDRSETGTEELLTVSHLTGVSRRSEKNVNMFMASTLEGYKRCEPGDLVINTMWAWMGALGMSDLHGVVSPSYHVYRLRHPTAHCPRFFDYVFRTPAYVAEITRHSRGVWSSRLRLYPDDFFDMEAWVPPRHEQQAIADFLDRKTAAIDELIEKKERMIELLQEKWQVLISQAVTKGVDPNVPMRDSGIDWLGKIPAHWTLASVRRYFESLDGQRVPIETTERESRPGEIPYYGASGIIDYVDGYLFDEPLVLVCEDGWNLLLRSQPVARALEGRAWVNNHAHVLRPHHGSIVFWAAAIEQTPFDVFVTGMRQPKLTAAALKSIPVVVPPEKEMRQIADLISDVESRSRTACGRLQRSCELLREYRSALITEAVTGKLDITQAKAR